MKEFDRLVDIVAALRAPDGCPWDRAQTIDSLKPFVLEEVYEVLQAIDQQDHQSLCEELGDYVFEAVFLAQLESEAGHFQLSDALASITDKLIRRHPHVFARGDGEPALATASDVVTRWEQIKAEERGGRSPSKTLLSGVPITLPALLRAYQTGLRAASVGFDWSRRDDVVDKIQEEVDELRAVAGTADRARAEEEMGDLLFSIANLSRHLGIEPETALRKANDKFTKRFEAVERAVSESGRQMRDMTIDDLEKEWKRAKTETETSGVNPEDHEL